MPEVDNPDTRPDDPHEAKSGNEFFNPFASEDVGEPFSDHWGAKRRVAQAIRNLTDVLVTSTPPTEQLHEIATALEEQAAMFAKSPRLNMWIDGNKAFGTVRCGYAYEGPPGHIHGGFVAAILDQFLGMAQLAGGMPGMTGSLEIRYLRPTPLNTELSLEAAVEPAGGRKTRVKGVYYTSIPVDV